MTVFFDQDSASSVLDWDIPDVWTHSFKRPTHWFLNWTHLKCWLFAPQPAAGTTEEEKSAHEKQNDTNSEPPKQHISTLTKDAAKEDTSNTQKKDVTDAKKDNTATVEEDTAATKDDTAKDKAENMDIWIG